MTLSEYLRRYASLAPIRMHMPGHKGILSPYDLTETEGTALGRIEDAVSESERLAAVRYGADTAKFLSGGSTLGILAAFGAVRGSEILFPRASHRSFYSACALYRKTPVLLETEYADGLPVPPSAEDVQEAIRANPKIAAVAVTSPDYFGRVCDLKAIRAAIGRRTLIVDAAHGAHFGLRREFPPSPCREADLTILSAHKTLPALTQSALALIANPCAEAFSDALGMLETTSPSYLLYASIESGIDRTIRTDCRDRIDAIGALPARVPADDPMRIVFDAAKLGRTGSELCRDLIERGIVPEFASSRHVVMIATCCDSAEEIRKIGAVLAALPKRCADALPDEPYRHVPRREVSFSEAAAAESEEVPLAEAVGRIAAAEAGLYPPCRPIVARGEIYDSAVVAALGAGQSFGVRAGRVRVMKR